MSRALAVAALALLVAAPALAAPLPPLPSLPATPPVAVHQCVPVPSGLPLLGPETCANAYVAPGRPGVGAEVYNRGVSDKDPSYVTSFAALDGRLYSVTAAGIVRSTNGTGAWRAEPTVPVGPFTGCSSHAVLGALDGKLYAGTSSNTGWSLWRLDAAGWVRVLHPALGCHAYALHAFGGRLYVATSASVLVAYDGTTGTIVANTGLGTAGNFNAITDDGTLVYAAAYPSGIWAGSANRTFAPLPNTPWLAAGLGASHGVAYATKGDTLYALALAGPAAAARFPNSSLGPVDDVAGRVGLYASGQLWRWDGVAATVLLESWSQTAFGALGTSAYLGAANGTVERLDFLVDQRPLP